MLRVEMRRSADAVTIGLEGRFRGEEAENVRALATRFPTEAKLVVDLTNVIFIDDIGEEVLSFLKRLGAEFVADTSYTLDFCERLHLPIACDCKSNFNGTGGSNG